MKLSEAIRAGCLMKPVQGFGSKSIETTQDKVCVLGAAGCGAGMNNDNWGTAFTKLRDEFPILNERVAEPPESIRLYSPKDNRLQTCMWILNDAFRWTRERIADWVEQIEQEVEECGLKEEGSNG